MREVMDRGFKPNIHAPLITLTYGLFGTKIVNPSLSNLDLILAFKYGLSENPPTMKIKFTGQPVFSASYRRSATLHSIFVKRG